MWSEWSLLACRWIRQTGWHRHRFQTRLPLWLRAWQSGRVEETSTTGQQLVGSICDFCLFFYDIISALLSIGIASGALMLRNICLDHLPVCLSVRKVHCGKMADWIRMPFGAVSGVGWGMGVLDEGGDRRREWAVLGVNLGRAIGDFVA